MSINSQFSKRVHHFVHILYSEFRVRDLIWAEHAFEMIATVSNMRFNNVAKNSSIGEMLIKYVDWHAGARVYVHVMASNPF